MIRMIYRKYMYLKLKICKKILSCIKSSFMIPFNTHITMKIKVVAIFILITTMLNVLKPFFDVEFSYYFHDIILLGTWSWSKFQGKQLFTFWLAGQKGYCYVRHHFSGICHHIGLQYFDQNCSCKILSWLLSAVRFTWNFIHQTSKLGNSWQNLVLFWKQFCLEITMILWENYVMQNLSNSYSILQI